MRKEVKEIWKKIKAERAVIVDGEEYRLIDQLDKNAPLRHIDGLTDIWGGYNGYCIIDDKLLLSDGGAGGNMKGFNHSDNFFKKYRICSDGDIEKFTYNVYTIDGYVDYFKYEFEYMREVNQPLSFIAEMKNWIEELQSRLDWDWFENPKDADARWLFEWMERDGIYDIAWSLGLELPTLRA